MAEFDKNTKAKRISTCDISQRLHGKLADRKIRGNQLIIVQKITYLSQMKFILSKNMPTSTRIKPQNHRKTANILIYPIP